MAKASDKKRPSVWPTRPLSEVAAVQTGIAKNAREVVDPVEVPYLRVANVHFGRLDLTEIKKIRVSKSDVARYQLRPGDILLTEGGDFDKLGRGTIWRGELETCLHQNHIFAVRCDLNKAIPEWIALLAESSYGRRYFTLCSKQSTNLASINSTQLKQFPVPLPSLEEQGAVTSRIATADACRAQVSRLIDLKRHFRQSCARGLLSGKVRFAEFARPNQGVGATEGGSPKDWTDMRLVELADVIERKNADGTTRVLTASGEHGLVDQRRYFSKVVAGDDLRGYYLLKRGEFAYNRSAMQRYPYGAIKRLDDYDEGVLSTLYLCFGIKDSSINSDYLAHYFESGLLNSQLRRIVRVGSRAHGLLNVTKTDFLNLHLFVPQRVEQERIADVLNLLDREILLLESLARLIAQQKLGLTQALVTRPIFESGAVGASA